MIPSSSKSVYYLGTVSYTRHCEQLSVGLCNQYHGLCFVHFIWQKWKLKASWSVNNQTQSWKKRWKERKPKRKPKKARMLRSVFKFQDEERGRVKGTLVGHLLFFFSFFHLSFFLSTSVPFCLSVCLSVFSFFLSFFFLELLTPCWGTGSITFGPIATEKSDNRTFLP